MAVVIVQYLDPTRKGLMAGLLRRSTRTGHDFTFYKRNTLHSRIERRMGIYQLDKITSYVRFMQENPQELDLISEEFLIGVTSFSGMRLSGKSCSRKPCRPRLRTGRKARYGHGWPAVRQVRRIILVSPFNFSKALKPSRTIS
jgi:hypothetical protein